MDILLEYGVLGIICALLISWVRTQIKREQDRSDRMEEAAKKLNTYLVTTVIPAVESATKMINDHRDYLLELQARMEAEKQRRRG